MIPLLLAAALAAATPVQTAPASADTGPISAARMSTDDQILASAAFEGRAPGTVGEARTIAWLIERLKAIALEPGGPGGAWTQPVAMVRTQVGTGSIAVAIGGKPLPLVQGTDVYLSTVRPVDMLALDAAPMVFVGHGAYAPERGWDDFKGVDLHGKIAVFLVNDPDFSAVPGEDAAGVFGGRRMTYHGRWTYKYDEAARRGAIGALIVHDTAGAGYGWSTVIAAKGESYDLADAPRRLMAQGWLAHDVATSLFARAGLDLDRLRVAARRRDFRPVPLPGATLTARLPVTHATIESHNVLARLTGARRPGEVVMYGAHWDAFGKGPDGAIRPGANDDGLGVAGLLEIARAFKAAPRPDRTIAFAFWTGEERGLLGSEAYALHPIDQPRQIVANITLDILQTGGPARDVMLVGQGQNDLEQRLASAAAARGRTVTPEALPERGLFYRADHFTFAKRGVPTLLFMAISGAPDLVDGGRAAGERWLGDYMACYHQPCDAWRPGLDLRGAAADVDLAFAVGRGLALSNEWPTWRAASEFAAAGAARTRR